MTAGDRPEPGRPEGDPSFEQILARLQHVVERLESGELALEDSLAVFEEGVRLTRLGARRRDDAERRVEELLGDGDPPRTRPLAGSRRDPDDDEAGR